MVVMSQADSRDQTKGAKKRDSPTFALVVTFRDLTKQERTHILPGHQASLVWNQVGGDAGSIQFADTEGAKIWYPLDTLSGFEIREVKSDDRDDG